MSDIEKAIEKYKEYIEENQDCASSNEVKRWELVIEALEKQLNGDWVPVSKRLPDVNETYVICTDGITVRELFYADKEFFSGVLSQTHKVIAWQPLPEPYKEAAK